MEINGQALLRELHRRGILLKDASVEMGYASNYLSIAIKRGTLSVTAATLIKSLYNIDPETYTVSEETKEGAPIAIAEAEKIAEEIATLTQELRQLKAVLYKVICSAMKAAMLEGFTEGVDDCLARVIERATLEAMTKALEGGQNNDDI